jgi:hypothetical protein
MSSDDPGDRLLHVRFDDLPRVSDGWWSGRGCGGGSESVGLWWSRAEWRRVGLQKPSIRSKIAAAGSARVVQVRRSSSSICIEPKNDSAIALS